jgi:hypothetical protein
MDNVQEKAYHFNKPPSSKSFRFKYLHSPLQELTNSTIKLTVIQTNLLIEVAKLVRISQNTVKLL